MTIYEKIEQLKNTTNLDLDNYQDTYRKAETELTQYIGYFVIGAEVNHQRYGIGKITDYRKDGTLECLVIDIEFANEIKQFSLAPVLGRIVNNTEIVDIWNAAYLVHNELTKTYNEIDRAKYQAQLEAEKKAEEERKATEKYEARKAKALKEFDDLTKQDRSKCATGEFYYALGWLAKNAGSITAALPDYLLNGFERYFGTEYTPTVVDSKKRTVNGNPMQWAMSMKVALPKKAQESVPATFLDYLNPNGTALTNTSFV
jgi:hypothetical protein